MSSRAEVNRVQQIFRAFEFHIKNGAKPISDVIEECLILTQDKVPDIKNADSLISPIIISALASVGVWHNMTPRDEILRIGFIDYDQVFPLDTSWKLEQHDPNKGAIQFKWSSNLNIPRTELRNNDKLNITDPRDGPQEVWSVASVGFLSGRRAVVSYVHDKNAENEVKWTGDRRSVRLSRKEAQDVQKPTFFKAHSAVGLNDVWHDGMKYASPDGQWNSYAGVIPYMIPGSAVWHLIPRIRQGRSGYPNTRDEMHDKILLSFIKLRNGESQLTGLNNLVIKHPTDKPYRDLSGVRRLWLMAEAICGMLRDDLIISVQDLAGLALTFMHYDKVEKELRNIIENYESTSEVDRESICCFPKKTTVEWAHLCETGEGANEILKQTLGNAQCDNSNPDPFREAAADFIAKIHLLKFWYVLLLAPGDIQNSVDLRFEVLEDLAVAPACYEEDRAKVYFMIEAAVINRLERSIPYEESIRRFMKAGSQGGQLLIQSVNQRSIPTQIEMTRVQIEDMWIYNLLAAFRNTAWKWNLQILRSAWIFGKPGLCYVGRFTASASKPLYLEAAEKWAGYKEEDVIRMATKGKQRMAVLITPLHRIFRAIDKESGAEIIVCSVFFMDEEVHNMALSCFGQANFHAERRHFRGESKRIDSVGNAVDFENSRYPLCAVNEKGTYFELREPSRVYQIIVIHEQGKDHGHLAGVRVALNLPNNREPVAVSVMDIIEHLKEEERTLFIRRPDQISPDGNGLVDYSFEYESIWVDVEGNALSTASVGGESVDGLVHRIVGALRRKDWV